jgi:hypothetical protein
MSFKMDRVHVWSVLVDDKPGGVSGKLAALADAGTNLEYVYTQRLPDQQGMGVLYVASIVGHEQVKAAKAAGFKEVFDPIVMRLEGDNKAGLAHRLKQEWAKAGLNLHGSILAVLGERFIGYITFDTVEDANKAATILAELGVEKPIVARAKSGT